MNVIQVLQELNIPYVEQHKNVRSDWVGLNPCPGCGSVDSHLAINLSHGYCCCWHCGPINRVAVLSKLAQCNVKTVCQLLNEVQTTITEKPTGKYTPPPGVGILKSCHLSYLNSRKINPKDAKKLWNIQGIDQDGGDHAWRLFIPITHNGVPVSWTTRAIGKSPIRYMTAKPEQESRSHRQCLFGLDYVRSAAIIVEGAMDAMRIGPGAVATLGIGLSQAQITLLSKIPIRTICFDSEQRAQHKARDLARTLEVMDGTTTVVELQTGKDPSDASDEEIQELRERFL